MALLFIIEDIQYFILSISNYTMWKWKFCRNIWGGFYAEEGLKGAYFMSPTLPLSFSHFYILFGSVWPRSNYCCQHYKLLLGFIGALQCIIEKFRPMKQNNNVSCGTGVTFICEYTLLLQESRIWKHMKGLEFNCVGKICHNWLVLLCFRKSGAVVCLILGNTLPFEQHSNFINRYSSSQNRWRYSAP